MFAAFLTTIFFSISIICGGRSAKMIGGSEANFWRLTFATTFLAIYALTLGQGISGDTFPIFVWSGVIGIGIGDVALFQTLPRLGSRLTLLLVQCLTAPFGAAIEWIWLRTPLSTEQIVCGVIILVGIAVSLSPGKLVHVEKKQLTPGLLFGVLAALGGAVGAVLSRKAYAVIREEGPHIDGATAAFQRLLGGLLVGGIALLIVKWRAVKGHLAFDGENPTLPSKEKWKRAGPWILANSLAGQTIGVSCYQWAFQTTPTWVVLSIVATAPLVAIPFAMVMEKERPSLHSIIGGVIAVAGVIAMAVLKYLSTIR